MYQLRHDEENWGLPVNIEKCVWVNFFGTIFTEKPFEIGKTGYIEVAQFEMDGDWVVFGASEKLFKKTFGLAK